MSQIYFILEQHYMFQTVLPSVVRSFRLYIQYQVYVIQVLWVLANGNEMELVSSSISIYLMLLCTVLYS